MKSEMEAYLFADRNGDIPTSLDARHERRVARHRSVAGLDDDEPSEGARLWEAKDSLAHRLTCPTRVVIDGHPNF